MRADSKQHYGGNGLRQDSNHQRRNWRDGTDITSFYFTRFPEDVTEKSYGPSSKSGGICGKSSFPNRETKKGGGMDSYDSKEFPTKEEPKDT